MIKLPKKLEANGLLYKMTPHVVGDYREDAARCKTYHGKALRIFGLSVISLKSAPRSNRILLATYWSFGLIRQNSSRNAVKDAGTTKNPNFCRWREKISV